MASARGPYRYVHDGELRDIFFLTPQGGQAFFLPQHTIAFPGSADLVVTPLLRDMLYLLTMNMGQRVQLERRIAMTLKRREQIVIRAKLLSLVGHILDKPWAFPALMDTSAGKAAFHELTEIASTSGTVANTASDPISDTVGGWVVRKLYGGANLSMAGAGLGLTRYFGGKSKDYYSFYAKRISDELALRGIPPSSLK